MERIDSDSELFTDGNPSTGVVGTRVKADWLNAVQEELANVIENAGLTLDPDDDEQLLEVALRRWDEWKKEPNAVAYVSSSSFTVATDRTAIYTEGLAVSLDQTTDGKGYVTSSTYSAGTGLTTVNVTGVTVDAGLAAVTFGQEPENAPYQGRYVEQGLKLANNASDADNDIDIAAGSALDSTHAEWMVLASALTKQLDAAWAAGDDAGGLDAGSMAADTWYHVWLIKNPTTAAVDALFSTSATSPTMPSGYTLKRRIGAVLTNSSGDILPFKQWGRNFDWVTPVVDYTNATLSGTVEPATSVPNGLAVEGRYVLAGYGTAAGWSYIFVHPSDCNAVSNVGQWASGNTSAASWGSTYVEMRTSTARKIKLSQSGVTADIQLITCGWRDPDAMNY